MSLQEIQLLTDQQLIDLVSNINDSTYVYGNRSYSVESLIDRFEDSPFGTIRSVELRDKLEELADDAEAYLNNFYEFLKEVQ
jgi:hypothetical protein